MAGGFRLGPVQLAGLGQLAVISSPVHALGVLRNGLLQGASAQMLAAAIDAEGARFS